MSERVQRPKSEKRAAGNPRRNALFGLVLKTCSLRRLDGGVRSQIRTRLPVIWPNIRVIFDKNREPVAKNVRKACGTATFRISDYFNIREEQGAWLPAITDQQVSERRTARAH